MKKSRPPVAFFVTMLKFSCFHTFLVMISLGVTLAENGYSQETCSKTVTLSINNQDVRTALSALEKMARVKFSYDPAIVPRKQVNLSVKGEPLSVALEKLLNPLRLSYTVTGKYIILMKLPENSGTGDWNADIPFVPPLRELKGNVTDEKGDGLPGVNILIKGTQRGVITDVNGAFAIDIPDENVVLVFSFVGYLSQELAVGNRTSLEVLLQVDEKSLEEVVVVGYGTQSRETITSAISKLDTRVLENVPYANAATALQGTLAGVRVQTTTGQPGAAPRVIVRGGTSINNPDGASPLYIIDGIIRSDMNHINSDDIESMQVLKDAASTAIYGARASNGVVIITTKSGKAGKMQVSYNYSLMTSEVGQFYDLVSARDFIKFYRLGVAASAEKTPARLSLLTQATSGGTGNDLSNTTGYTTQYLSAANEHKLKEGWESMPDPLDPSKTIIFQDTDWQNIFYKTGISHNHTLSASGGTERATFNVGLGFFKNQGTALGTDYTRLSLNSNGELKLKENLKVFSRLIYSKTFQNGVVMPFDRDRAQTVAPTAKYRFEDGSLAPGVNRRAQNPEYVLNSQSNKDTQDNLTVAVGSRWDLLPGLSFEPQVSIFTTIADSRYFQKAGYLAGPVTFNDTRSASASYAKLIQYQTDGVLSYNTSFKNLHNIDAKLGVSYYRRERSDLTASGQGAASDLIPTLNASSTMVSITGSESHQALLGYFSRINYDYDQKYLLSLNARYDGASNLGERHKWGLFPGVSVGWNMHKEAFWSALPRQISQLKVRGSYGINGNIGGLGDYQAQGVYGVGLRYGNNPVIANTTLANSELQWERSKTIDIGVDAGFFGNRINLLFDHYRRVTDNLLTSLPLPHSTGFGSILTNLGSLENKGIEIELMAKVFQGNSGFQWNVSLNASKVKSKILSLPPNGVENNRIGGFNVFDPGKGDYAWLGGLQEGGRIGDLYAYKQLGIYATDEAAAGAPTDMIIPLADKTKYGGDVNWMDVDGNGIIDTRDRVYVGNTFPLWTGGISNYLSYKNFNLAVRLDYTTGHIKYNWSRAFMLSYYGTLSSLPSEIHDSWQNQGDQTAIPRFFWADQNSQSNIARNGDQPDSGNSLFYEKGDYLAVREVSLSYIVSSRISGKMKISNLTFHVTGNNLHYFTGYKGLNPEDGGQESGGYPLPRNIIIGARVTF